MRVQKLGGSALAEFLLRRTAIDNGADTGITRMQRNMPEPAVRVGFNENIRLVWRRKVLRPEKIAIDGEVLEKRIPPPQTELATEYSTLATRIHDELRSGSAHRAIIGDIVYPSGPLFLEQHIHDSVSLTYLDPMLTAIVQEQLIKMRSPHLIGMGIALIGLAEIPTPRRLRVPPDHGGTVFGEETCCLNLSEDAKLFEHRQGSWQERFSHMRTRETLAFKE
jgi:hypothetical protein